MTELTSAQDDIVLLHAYLDGELDAAAALAMERRLSADPALAAERDRIEALRTVLRERLPREAPSPELRARIERAVGISPAPLRRSVFQPTWGTLAASIAATAIVASLVTSHVVAPQITAPTPRSEAGAVLSSHVRALMAPQPFDVGSSDRHTVKPWFNGRIVQAPRVVNLDASGFALAGGRIDVIDGSPAPTLIYKRRQHIISLIAVATPERGDTSPSREAQAGYNMVRWTDHGVAYWAISDLNATELEEFARLFRAAPAEG
jgi:anti-sigma factor RsiW